jgi:hypothetical protein
LGRGGEYKGRRFGVSDFQNGKFRRSMHALRSEQQLPLEIAEKKSRKEKINKIKPSV